MHNVLRFSMRAVTPSPLVQEICYLCEHPVEFIMGQLWRCRNPAPIIQVSLPWSSSISLSRNDLLNILLSWAKNEVAVCPEVCNCTKGHTDWWPLKIGHLCQEGDDGKVYYPVNESSKWWGHLNTKTFSPSAPSFETQESESPHSDDWLSRGFSVAGVAVVGKSVPRHQS
jgi:hypothetical protein